jgi:hypothetical protein
MKVRPSFAPVLVCLLYGGLAVSPGLQAAEPQAAPLPAATTPAPTATAEAPPVAASAPAATAPAGSPQPGEGAAQPQAVDGAAAPAAATKPATSDDDVIVCKQVEVFGSRVRRGKLCRTKKEWEMESQSAKDFSKAIQKGSATQPRDQGGG